MKSRFLIGTSILGAIVLGVAGTAAAQRAEGSIRERMRERAAERSAKPAENPKLTSIQVPGDYRFSFIHDGIRREYLVHVPKSYQPGQRIPMLMALHGGGGDADYQANDHKYRLISKSEEAGFIAVFPNGYSRFRSGVLATWNAGDCCAGALRNKVDDVGFLREVIERVSEQASIDRDRVYITGMSNGAMMAYRMACEASELVRAIAPIAGTDNTVACKPSRPVPVIHFHALNDEMVNFTGGPGAKSFTQVNFTSVPATISKWVELDRANPQPERIFSVSGARCDLHRARTGGAPVELCVTDSGGHSWPGGGIQQGRKQPSTAISANDLMWQFFSSL